MAAGSFRADLFHRLAVVTLRVPTLRERRRDIPQLIAYGVRAVGDRSGGPLVRIARDGLEVLTAYEWPGNVRELMNVVERAAACWPGRVVDRSLAIELVRSASLAPDSAPIPSPASAATRGEAAGRSLQAVVAHCDGNVARAARLLGLPRSTLRHRLRRRRDAAEQLELPGLAGDPKSPATTSSRRSGW